MSMTSRGIALILSALLLWGCGADEEAESPDATSDGVAGECTERDGGWFGQLDDGTLITSQTQEACEERLRE